MTSPLPAPPAIDYTSRDYASIRSDLIDLIDIFLPEWKSRSPNDFGIVLRELFAYAADGLHYYADRVANEAYLSTATQRASVIRLAEMLGDTPSLVTAAQATPWFTNATQENVTLPAGTQLAANHLVTLAAARLERSYSSHG